MKIKKNKKKKMYKKNIENMKIKMYNMHERGCIDGIAED